MARTGLIVAGISKRFTPKSRRALTDVSLVVPPGELLVLLGPNGAGKSTLMNLITGDAPVKSPQCQGAVSVAGVHLHGGSTADNITKVFRRSWLGYCAQHDALFDELSVMEHLNLYGQIRGLWKGSRSRAYEDESQLMCQGLGIEE